MFCKRDRIRYFADVSFIFQEMNMVTKQIMGSDIQKKSVSNVERNDKP